MTLSSITEFGPNPIGFIAELVDFLPTKIRKNPEKYSFRAFDCAGRLIRAAGFE